MKLSEVLYRAIKLLRYMRTRGKRKPIAQWLEMAGLPSEAVYQEIIGLDTAYKKNRVSTRLATLNDGYLRFLANYQREG